MGQLQTLPAKQSLCPWTRVPPSAESSSQHEPSRHCESSSFGGWSFCRHFHLQKPAQKHLPEMKHHAWSVRAFQAYLQIDERLELKQNRSCKSSKEPVWRFQRNAAEPLKLKIAELREQEGELFDLPPLLAYRFVFRAQFILFYGLTA